MENLYISIGIIAFIIAYVLVMIKHVPKRKLTDDVKELILKNGLIHFTSWHHAENIQKEGLMPKQEKPMFPLEKNMVWLYLNNEDEFQTKFDIIRKKGKRKKYDSVVFFTKINERNLEKMRYRKSDMSIVYIGQFKPKCISIKKLR